MSAHGVPLLLIPGYMLDETLWDGLKPELGAPQRQLVHLPLAGGATIAGMARAALETAQAAVQGAGPEGRFDLLGFSMGGYVAREIARLAPERVRSLILVATSSRADTPLQVSQRQAAAQARPLGPFKGLGRAAIIHSLHPDNAANAALIDQVRAMGERLGRAAFIEQSMIVRDSDRQQLAQIQCPTLVIAAAQDQMRSLQEAEELAAGIPHATLRIIDKAGHMIPLEQPAALAQLIAAWQPTPASET